MAVVPSSHTFATGVATSSEMNSFVRDPIAYLLTPPTCVLRQASTQSIPNNVFTAILFDQEDVDSVNGHSTSSNTSRYVAQYAGWYLCGGGASFAASAAGQRSARWAVNGTATNYGSTFIGPPSAGGCIVPAFTQLLFLNVSDYVELQAFQNSGGALNTIATPQNAPTASIIWQSN